MDYKKGQIDEACFKRAKLLMDEVGASPMDRVVVKPALDYAEFKRSLDPEKFENVIAMAIELPDGRIVTGRSSELMVAGASMLLNAVKALCGIPDERQLVSDDVLETIQHLKHDVLGKQNSSLNVEEVLTALTISSSVNPMAGLAVNKLTELRDCKAHCTAILSEKDEQALRALGIDITSNPEFSNNNLYSV